MTQLLTMSGIPRRSAVRYENILQVLEADEETYVQTKSDLFPLVFSDHKDHGAQFLNCISKYSRKKERSGRGFIYSLASQKKPLLHEISSPSLPAFLLDSFP